MMRLSLIGYSRMHTLMRSELLQASMEQAIPRIYLNCQTPNAEMTHQMTLRFILMDPFLHHLTPPILANLSGHLVAWPKAGNDTPVNFGERHVR